MKEDIIDDSWVTKGSANLVAMSSSWIADADEALWSSNADHSPNVSPTNEPSSQEIVDAIRENMGIAQLKEIIETTCSNNASLSEFFSLQSQLDLVQATLQADRGDVLEMLLQKGISPDIKCPIGLYYNTGITALQEAADLQRLDLVKILMDHKANVNVGKSLHSDMYGYFTAPEMCPPNCENALVVAFWYDNPVLMKLLLPGYDKSCIPDGKPPIYLALTARAIKCITSLLTDEDLKMVIDPSIVPLRFGNIYSTNILAMLYEVGCRQGAYSSDDLNMYLSDITHIPTTGICYCANPSNRRSCLCNGRNLGRYFNYNLEEVIGTLLDLGADINFESPETKATPLEGLLKTMYFAGDSDIVKRAARLLLHHRGTAAFDVVNSFFLHLCTIMLKGTLDETEQVAIYTLDMMCLLHEADNLKLIKGWCSRGCDRDYPEPHRESLRDMCRNIGHEPSFCPRVQEAIRLLVLNVDISFTELIKSILKPGSQCPEARYMFVVQITSVLPHTAYQLMVRKVHMVKYRKAASKVRAQAISQHFPSILSLKQLTRVTILDRLPFPRTISSEALGLPKMLQNYVCLK